MDGVPCIVIEMTDGGQESLKMWVHEEYGIPVRVEQKLSDGSQTVMEYKNIKVGPQSDSEFQLPSGVEVTDLGSMMPNMPQMPAGGQ